MDTSNLTLIDLCKRLAKTKPEAEAFLFFDKHGTREICTPHDLYVTACRFASLLRQWGFEHGDVVANALPNSPERLVTDFGVMFAGCVPMNCQTHEKDGADFWNNAKISQCKGVIFSCHAQDPVYHLLAPFLQPETDTSPGIAVDISTQQAPDLKKAIVCRRKLWSERENIQPLLEILRDPSEFPDEDVDNMPVFEAKPSDTAYVLLTSGSTGYCKMVPRTHQELVSTIFAIDKLDRGKMFNDRPLGWAGGFPYDFYDECIPRVLHVGI